eukprot:3518143-Ditylum_brightwellii.AAC.2
MITTTSQELFHLQRANSGLTDCDAEVCYARMLPRVVSIAEINAGAPEKNSTLMTRTLEQMKYHMTTAKGISEEFNQNTPDKPMFGAGQGATDGPAKWTLTDNIIAKTYNKKATGCTLHDPTKEIVKKQNSAQFVDDVIKLHNNKNFDTDAQTIMEQIQKDVNLHGRYIWVSGGHLELNKTLYDLLIWKFTKTGRLELMTEEELPENIVKIIDATGIKVQLQRAKTNNARRMLGVRQASSLQMDTEFKIQLGKTPKFGCAMVACPLQKHECFLSYKTVYIPSIT